MPGPKIFNIDFQTEIGNALVGAGGFRPAVVTRTTSEPVPETICTFSRFRLPVVRYSQATFPTGIVGQNTYVNPTDLSGDYPISLRLTNTPVGVPDDPDKINIIYKERGVTELTWNNFETELTRTALPSVSSEFLSRTTSDQRFAGIIPTPDYEDFLFVSGAMFANGDIFAAILSEIQAFVGNQYYICFETPNPDFNHGKLQKVTAQTEQCHATVKLKAVRNKDGIVTGHENQVSLLASTLTMNGQPFVPQVGDKVTFQDETPNPEYTLTELVKAGAGKVSYRFTAT